MKIDGRILIADSDSVFANALKSEIEQSDNIKVETVNSVQTLKYACEKKFYNVIIVQKEIIGIDELEYLQSCKDANGLYSSEIILLSDTADEDTAFNIGNGKLIYSLKKTSEFSQINKIITEKVEGQKMIELKMNKNDSTLALERSVTSVMHALGIPAHIKGYQFLRTAIMKAVTEPEIINYITKSLYPTVAKAHGTTPSRVERAIRHAIEVAWDRGDVDTLNSYFGYTISRQRGKPTNSEFIAMIADNIRMENSNVFEAKHSDELKMA